MRPEDILADPGRRVLQARRLPHRSGAAGRAGADHAWPFRPRPRRPRRGAGDAGDARHDAAALRRGFRRHDAGGRATARARPRRRHGDVPSGRPRARLGADRGRRRTALRIVASGDYKDVADPTCAPFELVPCDVFITEATFGAAGVPPSATRRRDRQAPALGRAVSRARASRRRLFARQGAARHRAASARPATTRRSICTARWRRSRAITSSAASISASCGSCAAPSKAELAGAITLCPPSALKEVWARRFPDPVTAFASGWMRVRARARQRGVELPLVISDHADWDGLTATIAATGAVRDLGDARPGGRAGALVRARAGSRRGRSTSSAMATRTRADGVSGRREPARRA